MEEKHNISLENSQSVEIIDFSHFVKKIGPVKFVKMDIEGAEYDCIPHLIETGAMGLIPHYSPAGSLSGVLVPDRGDLAVR